MLPVLVFISLLVLASCSALIDGTKDRPRPAATPSIESIERPSSKLSPAQDYAGEILAYFMQVVVGHIGSEKSRKAWRSAGNEAALDFETISEIMGAPASSKTDLMVLDFDLVALVEILSHYNPRFNLFKGQTIFTSVYPSAELIALRLLIQRKRTQGEKVSLTALQEREALLRHRGNAPSAADLSAMNLSGVEFRLVKDVFASEPLFFQYYKHPFIVDALTRIGFYQNDPLTDEIVRRANYRPFAPRHLRKSNRSDPVTVVVLPTFTREFEFGGAYQEPYIYGFKPSADYRRALKRLRDTILNRTADLLIAELRNSGKASAENDLSWKALWDNVYAPLVEFKLFDQRPLTIHPGNDDRMVNDICPAADLVILLLGEGIERIIEVADSTDKFNATGRLYFSVDDIRYYKTNDKIDEIAQGVVDRLLAVPVSGGNTGIAGR